METELLWCESQNKSYGILHYYNIAKPIPSMLLL